MQHPLRVLLLEDDPLDAELTIEALRSGGFTVETQRIESEPEYQRALNDCPDVILSDFSMPQYDGSSALRLALERCPEVPFIFVSGALGEEQAVETLKAGATDYVLKHRLDRLVFSVRRALQEAEVRRERKRLQEELKNRAEELALAGRRKDEFLATLGHELRNPVGALRIAVDILRNPGGTPIARQRALEVADRQLSHIASMIDDLLDVSRISRGKIELQIQRLDLVTLIRDVVEDHQQTASNAGLTIKTRLPDEPLYVDGDRTRLDQVLDNLIQNAMKFTDPGGVITIECSQDMNDLVVSVSDTGIGIAQDLLNRMFEPFAQAEQTLARSRGGLGLGLAVVKSLIVWQGGSIEAYSAGPGHGARFTFRLPCKPAPVAAHNIADTPASVPSGHRVLVIDDNRDAADTLCDLLELYGHDVAVAYTGATGVELARQFQPEIILCDIGLPEMDGYAVAGKLREDPNTARARLVAISGYGREEDRRRAERAGFDAHITKPVDQQRLEAALSIPQA